jgi:hypothetical protein
MKESNALNLILIKIITSIYGAVTSVIARVGSTFAKSRRQGWSSDIEGAFSRWWPAGCRPGHT